MTNSGSSRRSALRKLFIPRDRFAQTLTERIRSSLAKLLRGARSVQATTRLPVRLRRIPADGAPIAASFADLFKQSPDRNLLARSEIDGIGFLVLFRCRHDPFRRVFHVKKF